MAAWLVLTSASASAQSFVPSARVQDDLRLSAPASEVDEGPSRTDMAWIAIGLDGLFNLATVAAAYAITGGVATLQIVNLPTASTSLALLDVAMLAVQPLAQAFIVYEVGRMNPRYEPQLGWTILGAYGGTLLGAGIVGLISLAVPGGTGLAVLAAVTLTVVPPVVTVLVQSATTVERVAPSLPAATVHF
jgi:hypothetical protein